MAGQQAVLAGQPALFTGQQAPVVAAAPQGVLASQTSILSGQQGVLAGQLATLPAQAAVVAGGAAQLAAHAPAPSQTVPVALPMDLGSPSGPGLAAVPPAAEPVLHLPAPHATDDPASARAVPMESVEGAGHGASHTDPGAGAEGGSS